MALPAIAEKAPEPISLPDVHCLVLRRCQVQKLADLIPRIGEPAETNSTLPALSSALSSKPTPSPQSVNAAVATDRLFAWCLMPDVGDPEVYLAGVTAILGEYPVEVMNALSDPRMGSRVLKDYPTISQIRQACEVLNEPIAREEERAHYKRLAEETLKQFPPRPPRTSKEQQRIDEKIRAWRRSHGIPETGLPRRTSQARELPHIPPERMRAVLADCDARRLRKRV
jgi:hypothetical protein